MRTLSRTIRWALAISAAAPCVQARPAIDSRCIIASGGAAARCARQYAATVVDCRLGGDAACGAALAASGGTLGALLAATEKPVRDGCTADAADRLTSQLGVDDLVARTAQACRKWGEDFVVTTVTRDPASLSRAGARCQRILAAQLARLRDAVVGAFGHCFVADFSGRRCGRAARDRRTDRVRARVRRFVIRGCGLVFDTLGLVPSPSGGTPRDRIDALLDVVVERSRHLALRVYPPLDLGPTAFPGPHPVGVRTLSLSDPTRANPAGTGPRALVTEVYYPSTPEAVAGVPRDVVSVLGFPLIPNPSYRDVARASGTFPLVVYSPGSGEPRFVDLMLMVHLASHGFVAVAIDHEGNGLLDPDTDPDTLVNRPRDVSAVLDRLLALAGTPGDFLEGALDRERIGGAGHSLGGYTMLALAAGPTGRGTFTDPRIKAIVPLDGSAQLFEDTGDAPAIFATIHVPTLLFSGSRSPALEPRNQVVYDTIPTGAAAVAFADLRDAGHLTFTDICEVPDDLLIAFGGGLPPECQPEMLPWRYARHVVDYLTLNFLDGVLNDDAGALSRLHAIRLSRVEDLRWQRK